MRAAIDRDGYGLWAVEVKTGGQFAGIVGINEITDDLPFTPKREVGWRLAFDTWGYGYATEGARAAVDFAFGNLGWDEVVAMTAAINERSQRVMQRLGMLRNPADDFDHPRVEPGSPLRPHVLYRVKRPAV